MVQVAKLISRLPTFVGASAFIWRHTTLHLRAVTGSIRVSPFYVRVSLHSYAESVIDAEGLAELT